MDSCSACYGYLIPALERLRREGLLEKLSAKICIGQGYRGQTGELGIGSCTSGFTHSLKGCPPVEDGIYRFLRTYIEEKREVLIYEAEPHAIGVFAQDANVEFFDISVTA